MIVIFFCFLYLLDIFILAVNLFKILENSKLVLIIMMVVFLKYYYIIFYYRVVFINII